MDVDNDGVQAEDSLSLPDETVSDASEETEPVAPAAVPYLNEAIFPICFLRSGQRLLLRDDNHARQLKIPLGSWANFVWMDAIREILPPDYVPSHRFKLKVLDPRAICSSKDLVWTLLVRPKSIQLSQLCPSSKLIGRAIIDCDHNATIGSAFADLSFLVDVPWVFLVKERKNYGWNAGSFLFRGLEWMPRVSPPVARGPGGIAGGSGGAGGGDGGSGGGSNAVTGPGEARIHEGIGSLPKGNRKLYEGARAELEQIVPFRLFWRGVGRVGIEADLQRDMRAFYEKNFPQTKFGTVHSMGVYLNFDRLSKSICRIYAARDGEAESSFSGFICGSDTNSYYILTCFHGFMQRNIFFDGPFAIQFPSATVRCARVSEALVFPNLNIMQDEDIFGTGGLDISFLKIAKTAMPDLVIGDNYIKLRPCPKLLHPEGVPDRFRQRVFVLCFDASSQVLDANSFRISDSNNTIVGYQNFEVMYTNCTEPCYSGSPVVDCNGRLVAVHRMGGKRQGTGMTPFDVFYNVGVRIDIALHDIFGFGATDGAVNVDQSVADFAQILNSL